MAVNDEVIAKVGEWKQRLGLTQTTQAVDGRQPSLLKGILAGFIGGLAGTAAKSAAERFFPPRTHGEPEPPSLLAERVAGHSLSTAQNATATEAIHWSFGALTGAAYGGLAEFFPQATQKEGATFGLSLSTLTHKNALPALGLTAPPDEQTSRERASEVASHVVYGVVTEVVRSVVRRMLD
jgi:putative membrane protein